MKGARGSAAIVVALVLAAASACSALAPNAPLAASAACSGLTPGSIIRSLREAASYEFRARGTVARYDASVGDADRVEHIDARGEYVAPNRLNLAYAGHEAEFAELRRIGPDEWVRSHGSRRWRAADPEAMPLPVNQLLAEIERVTSWSAPDAKANPGWCTLSGDAAFVGDDQAPTADVTVTTPLADSMPAEIGVDYRYEPPPRRAGALSSRQLHYEVMPIADPSARIEPPLIDMTPATDDDLRYALRHLGCHEAPCSIANLEIEYAYRSPTLQMIGWEAGGRAGEAWFDSGRIRHVVKRCSTPAFSWHEHTAEDGRTFLGGHLALVESAVLRVMYSDGSSEDLPISGPAYVVPNRAHTDDGASIVDVELLGPYGRILAEAPDPGHEEHSSDC